MTILSLRTDWRCAHLKSLPLENNEKEKVERERKTMGKMHSTITIGNANEKAQELPLPQFCRPEAVLGPGTRDDCISVPLLMKLKDTTIGWKASLYSTEGYQISINAYQLLL